MRPTAKVPLLVGVVVSLAAASGCINGDRSIGSAENDAGASSDTGVYGGGGGGGPVTVFGDTGAEDDAGPWEEDGGADSCGSGATLCDGTCVDTSTSNQHCGSCGNSCTGPSSCSNGTCKCPGGGTMCSGQCVDTSSSDQHCGSCGNSCSGAQSCNSGSCECPSGESFCNGSCIDTSSDTSNCGNCGHSCDGGEICSSGTCAPSKKVANVISETNKVRSSKTDCGRYGILSKAKPLKGNAALHKAAQKHADDMVNNDFFSHTGSDGSNFGQRANNAGFTGQPIGENIAAGNSTAAATVQQWKGSDGHCRNMMNSTANVIGVGVARGGKYGWYWVQVFGYK